MSASFVLVVILVLDLGTLMVAGAFPTAGEDEGRGWLGMGI
jgi:hypothetical protein